MKQEKVQNSDADDDFGDEPEIGDEDDGYDDRKSLQSYFKILWEDT